MPQVRRISTKCLVFAAAVWLLPSIGSAQATITGTVRDTSNAVLPGVSLEPGTPGATRLGPAWRRTM
jgi:hypothetical protein